MRGPFERPARPRARLGAIALTGTIGFLAGVAGGLIATSLILPWPTTFPDLVLRRERVSRRPPNVLPSFPALSASVVDLFAVEGGKELPALLPLAHRTGRGVAVTSDGWVVTVRAALPTVARAADRRVPVAVGRDRRILRVDRVALDPTADLAFLHVPDLDATVLPMRDRMEPVLGESLAVPTVEGGLAASAVRAVASIDAGAGGVHSSDRWRSVLTIAPAVDAPAGTPVADVDGALLGLLITEDRALPVDAIATAMASLFRSGAVERNALGIIYRDASELARGPGGVAEGAIVTSDPRHPPRAPLVAGDIILAVGDEPLTSWRLLGDLLQEYPLGVSIELRVRRGERLSEIVVPLTRTRGDVLIVAAPPARPSKR